jgi:hypothetical protein
VSRHRCQVAASCGVSCDQHCRCRRHSYHSDWRATEDAADEPTITGGLAAVRRVRAVNVADAGDTVAVRNRRAFEDAIKQAAAVTGAARGFVLAGHITDYRGTVAAACR